MRVAALLVPLLLAGCLAPDAAVLQPPASDTPLAVDVSLSGCREVGVGRFVSFERARELLPDGFEPADAAGFLGMPTPAGRAAVLSGHLSCAGSVLDGGPVAWSDLIVPIEPPRVEGLALDAGKIDVYQLAQFTSGAATAALFGSVGFEAFLADVTSDTGTIASPSARASTTVDGTTLLRFQAAGAVEQTFRLDARFWHVTPTGLAYVEHARTPTPLRFGVAVSCEAAAGSAFAEAFGTAGCAGRDSFGGIFPEPSDFASTFHHLPGARVASGS